MCKQWTGQAPVSYESSHAQERKRNSKQQYSSGYSLQRILALSRPKESKQIWLTSFGPNLRWGHQDMMWPLPKAALHKRPTQRLMELTKPKRNFQLNTLKVNRPEFVYSCGRNSQIWEVGRSALESRASERVLQLALPKNPPKEYKEDRLQHQYSCGRVSPIWNVPIRAQTCKERPRTAELAKSKRPHPEYVPNSEVMTTINPTALKAYCTMRVSDLARPKSRGERPFIDSRSPEESIWKVSMPARSATASPRVMEMAKFKGYADGYVANRSVQWPVSRATRRALATPRQEQLSAPIVRASMDHVQFNPDAFLVSEAAKKARCTPRLEELSHPIQR
ncbi:sperm microtubule associated protein 2-like isoform X1 [Styela clava]